MISAYQEQHATAEEEGMDPYMGQETSKWTSSQACKLWVPADNNRKKDITRRISSIIVHKDRMSWAGIITTSLIRAFSSSVNGDVLSLRTSYKDQ